MVAPTGAGEKKLLGYRGMSPEAKEALQVESIDTIKRLRTELGLSSDDSVETVLTKAYYSDSISRKQADEVYAGLNRGAILELKKELVKKTPEKEKKRFVDKVKNLENIHFIKHVSSGDIKKALTDAISKKVSDFASLPDFGNLMKHIKQKAWEKVGDFIWDLVSKRVPWLSAFDVGVDALDNLIDVGKRKSKPKKAKETNNKPITKEEYSIQRDGNAHIITLYQNTYKGKTKEASKKIGDIDMYYLNGLYYMNHVGVEKAFRGKSYGTKLLKKAISYSSKKIFLIDASKKDGWYSRHGFKLMPREHLAHERIYLHEKALKKNGAIGAAIKSLVSMGLLTEADLKK